MIIHLHKLHFHSYHGVYPQESVTGGPFEMDVDVHFQPPSRVQALEDTINYAGIYELIKQRMATPTPLLETVVQDLADLIKASDQRIEEVAITLRKMNPPIAGFDGIVGVTHRKSFTE